MSVPTSALLEREQHLVAYLRDLSPQQLTEEFRLVMVQEPDAAGVVSPHSTVVPYVDRLMALAPEMDAAAHAAAQEELQHLRSRCCRYIAEVAAPQMSPEDEAGFIEASHRIYAADMLRDLHEHAEMRLRPLILPLAAVPGLE